MNYSTLIATKDMSREEWLEYRKKGIGGSDAAAIAGLDNYRSAMTVWLEKTGRLEPEEVGEAAHWGTLLEPLVADEFTRQTGKKVQRRNAILQHKDYPWMLANVDRLVVGEDAGLECKTTSEWLKDAWEDEKVPERALIQAYHYMAVTGCQKWYVAALIGGNKFKWTTVERNEEAIQALIKLESDFWNKVQSDVPPEPDGSEASSNAISSIYPTAEVGLAIKLSPDIAEWVEIREQARLAEKAAKERKEEAENHIKAALGTAEKGDSSKYIVTWKNGSRSYFNKSKLEEDLPDIYSQYYESSNVRTLRITEVKTDGK